MKSYRTEVEIKADRQLNIQLPQEISLGQADVTVVLKPQAQERTRLLDHWLEEPDPQGLDWWEQFFADLDQTSAPS